MNKKSLLIVIPHLTIGGVQKTLVSASKALDYDKYDVMAMKECIEHLLKYLNDKSSGKTTITVATLPITATQFVRKELAAACNKDKKYKWKFFLGTKLDENQYKACVMAYSGGYVWWLRRIQYYCHSGS